MAADPDAADAIRGTALDLIETVASRTEVDGTITRPFGTPSLEAAFGDVGREAERLGLTVRRDGVGNLIARHDVGGAERTLLLGGHLDSVPDAGRFDGVLGVACALAAVERLQGRPEPLPFAIEVVALADEEGTRFQTAYLGSTALLGALTDDDLDRRDAAGVAVRELVDVAAVTSARGRPDAVAWIEVHLEQGPVLEQAGRALGVVSAITGQTRVRVALTGTAGHAGTVPMEGRRDALAGAAEVILAVEQAARARPGARATVGDVRIAAMASNVIPGSVALSIDLRHAVDGERESLVGAVHRSVVGIARARNLEAGWEVVAASPAVRCDERVSAALRAGAGGIDAPDLVSGAGHDAAALAAAMPVGMLFVRCRGGISHNPAEHVDAEDIELAVAALVGAVEHLAVDR